MPMRPDDDGMAVGRSIRPMTRSFRLVRAAGRLGF